MEQFVKSLVFKSRPFFIYYYSIVILLIVWSYIEGVGDIQGKIKILSGPDKGTVLLFKAGYFSTLNYGIFYLFILPIFFQCVFETYKSAFEISELKIPDNQNSIIVSTVNEYSSKLIKFLKTKISLGLFIAIFLIFAIQSIIVERTNIDRLSLGWIQGLELKKKSTTQRAFLNTKVFYYKNKQTNDYLLQKIDSTEISSLRFMSKRVPSRIEFLIFVSFAKLFYCLFETVVFFYNINVLFCLIWFFLEKKKSELLGSPEFIRHIEKLITKISLSGFFLTIFVYFRFIANIQKGTFKPYDVNVSVFENDQYLFLFGMLFIPLSSITLFLYVYASDKAIDIKGVSFRKLLSLYIPSVAFMIIFFIYLLEFDPYMRSQLNFLIKIIKPISDFLI